MAWTGQAFSVGQILTAAQMTNLQADITALANADSGSPSIVDDALVSDFNYRYITGGSLSGSTTSYTGAFSDAYDLYMITLSSVYGSSGTPQMSMRIGQSGSYKSSAGDYRNDGVSDTLMTVNTAIASTSSARMCAHIFVQNPGTSAGHKAILTTSFLANSASTREDRSGFYEGNQSAITDIQFLLATGTFSGGVCRIYGVEGA